MVKYIFFFCFCIFSFGFAQDDISGCTDSYAANYNPDASIDDGSCSGYLDNGDYSLSFGGDGDYTHLDWSENMSWSNLPYSYGPILGKFKCRKSRYI